MSGMVGKIKLYLNTDVLLSLLVDEEKKGVKLGENVASSSDRRPTANTRSSSPNIPRTSCSRWASRQEYLGQVLRPMLLMNGSDLLLANEDILRGALKLHRMSEMPFLRALHIVFAQRNNAIIVTRDFDTANSARTMAGVMKPEDLLA